MDCLVLPVTMLRRRFSNSRLGYRPLSGEGFESSGGRPVTVVVGEEKREFLVDRYVLEEDPFRILIETMKKDSKERFDGTREEKSVIFVDVDAILFEHMLWLMYNDCSSLFKLNVGDILDFYGEDI
ncbi:auxin-responsive protein SAUR77 [Telopea speciosissima]|uniref:auxin-responsive protein SAUR77 n=1 Tax=Telopea speciosissima TaxID=54955 RepID=UPI001CC64820|nr:auxin-responsive protein SAUR77 [Telopea speciosissima]